MGREETNPEEHIQSLDDWDEKIQAMQDHFGLSREDAIAELVDLGEIAPLEWPQEEETKIQTVCPKCGNKQPLEEQNLVFYPNVSQEESERLNYKESACQVCGFKWNKYTYVEGEDS